MPPDAAPQPRGIDPAELALTLEVLERMSGMDETDPDYPAVSHATKSRWAS